MSQKSKTPIAMPDMSPMVMLDQDLTRPFHDPDSKAPSPLACTVLFRWLTFLPAIGTTLALVLVFSDWFRKDGFLTTEIIMLILVGFSAFWIALSVAAATIGLLAPRKDPRARQSTVSESLNIALTVPIYNEDPDAVISRIRAMRDDLSNTKTNHRFAIFILSDTRDEEISEREWELFEPVTRSTDTSGPEVYYRRRQNNTERKTGNLRDWIENWGGDWDCFITLDADSLMSARTITRLADEISDRSEVALLQSIPRLMGAQTIFSRVQQFANNIYGHVLADGLERWSGHDGNYWGHNAIIRTKAFATCAGLPRLQGTGALGGTIKSHDFVEAALLRRAGWSVRLLPDLQESYEETPQTLVDYVLRDRRWCQGNLQHLRLISMPGLKAASRFHMLQGAMAYIASVVWFLLLIVWALMGRSENDNVFRYFTDTNPLFPNWPEMDIVSRAVILGFMLGMLLIPKLFGILRTILRDPTLSSKGGRLHFAFSAFSEIILSFMLAPILMVQHMSAVFRTIMGLDAGWSPQNRSSGYHRITTLLRFHAIESFVGLLLTIGIALGVISLWLVPIALSLIMAVPISWVFGQKLTKRKNLSAWLETEEAMSPSPIIVSVRSKALA